MTGACRGPTSENPKNVTIDSVVPTPTRRTLITGASTGIGIATVQFLRSHGREVVATTRRVEHLEALVAGTGCTWMAANLRESGDVERLAGGVPAEGSISAVVNNAGGASGVDLVAEGSAQEWATMYEHSVPAALRVGQTFLSELRERGGDLVSLTSMTAHDTYPGGDGYMAAEHAERIITNALHLELVGELVRVIEIVPGMIATGEFSLNRLYGDAKAAAKVYADIAEPLSADDVTACIIWTLELPAHVNTGSMVIWPRTQASNTLVAREQ